MVLRYKNPVGDRASACTHDVSHGCLGSELSSSYDLQLLSLVTTGDSVAHIYKSSNTCHNDSLMTHKNTSELVPLQRPYHGDTDPATIHADHVAAEKDLAKTRAVVHSEVNLLSSQSQEQLIIDGMDPEIYRDALLAALRNCQTPQEKCTVLQKFCALEYVKSVDIWYVKDPSDSAETKEVQDLASVIGSLIDDYDKPVHTVHERNVKDTHFFIQPSMLDPEHFATLTRMRTLATMTYRDTRGKRRRCRLEERSVISMSATAVQEFPTGYVLTKKRDLQHLIGATNKHVMPIDTLYYLVVEDCDPSDIEDLDMV